MYVATQSPGRPKMTTRARRRALGDLLQPDGNTLICPEGELYDTVAMQCVAPPPQVVEPGPLPGPLPPTPTPPPPPPVPQPPGPPPGPISPTQAGALVSAATATTLRQAAPWVIGAFALVGVVAAVRG